MKASQAYNEAVVGVFTHSGSMYAMATFARANIFSHYDSIMAVAGTGGAKSSAFHYVAHVSCCYIKGEIYLIRSRYLLYDYD
jgi:hypothetical protein